MKLKTLLLIISIASQLIAVPVRWDVDIAKITEKEIVCRRGESLILEAQLIDRGKSLNTAAASATIYWQTNGMESAWWQRKATVSPNGLIEASFDASMDCGANQYRFFIGITGANDINYRAGGVIKILSSPGENPTTVDLKTAQTINFAQVEVVNAPWLTASETAIAINAAKKDIEEEISNAINNSKAELKESNTTSINDAITGLNLDEKLSSKQDKLSSQELKAIQSGVTTGTVAQVAANLASITALAELQKDSASRFWVMEQGFLTSHQDLTPYATIDFVTTAINGIQFPMQNLTGYATEDWVKGQGYLTAHQDLSPYATKDYVDNAISQKEPPPDLSGYATEAWVQGQGFLTSHQDLTPYATIDFVAQALNGIQFPSPDLTGYATEAWVNGQGFLTSHQDLSNYATHSYVDNVVARLTDSPEAGSVTRLYSPNGDRYIDGTGGVWRAEARYAWLEDGYQVPFEPTDTPTKWVNPQTGATLELENPKENRWVISLPPPKEWGSDVFFNVGFIPQLDDSEGTMYWEYFYNHAWGQYTNIVLSLKRVEYPGFWWHPVDRLANTSEVRKIDDLTVKGALAYYCEEEETFYVQSPENQYKYEGPNGVYLDFGYPSYWFPEGEGCWRVVFDETGDYELYDSEEMDEFHDPNAQVLHFQGRTCYRTNITDRIALESIFTNYYSRAEVDSMIASSGGGTGGIAIEKDPTVPDWAKSPTKPTYSASEVGAPTKAEFEEHKEEASLVYQLFSGSNIVAEVTNYNSAVHAPSLRILRMGDDGKYNIVWSETNGLERIWKKSESNTLEKVTSLETKVEKTYAPRAWSKTTSGLGAEAPNETTWVSTPTMVIAGGLEFQKTITSSGQLWFLRSNGMTTIGKNNAGIFDISAADGKSIFTIEKTDSYLVGVSPDSINVNGNTVTMTLNVVSDEHPYLRYSPSLSPANWEKEEDGFISPVSVSWQGSSGAWVCTVQTTASEGFSPLNSQWKVKPKSKMAV